MSSGVFTLPRPVNEPVLAYAPGRPSGVASRPRLDAMARERDRDPAGHRRPARCAPARTATAVCRTTTATSSAELPPGRRRRGGRRRSPPRRDGAPRVVARRRGRSAPRCFLRAAELLAGPWRDTLNAATMLGQSKTAYQAEIDAACELIDFWRFNVALRAAAHDASSRSLARACGTSSSYRPLEGFVFAVTPFNFTAIAGNLPTAPAMMGNTVVWKPARPRVLAAYYPDEAAARRPACRRGVINFVPGRAARSATPCSTTPTSPASTSPARPPCSRRCGRRSARTSPATAATRARRRDRRQGLHLRPPLGRRRRRSPTAIVRGALRVPGPEVLGRLARLRPALAVAGAARALVGARSASIRDGRRRATSATSWAR